MALGFWTNVGFLCKAHAHPEWFAELTGYKLKHAINGIAKRIVGEIIAVGSALPHERGVMTFDCSPSELKNGVAQMPSTSRDMGQSVPRLEADQS